MRQAARKVLPGRNQWHHIGEFTLTEADQLAFRDARTKDAVATALGHQLSQTATPAIDWKHWENAIQHKELVKNLHKFHTEQMKSLTELQKEDHSKVVEAQKEGWELFEEAVSSCQKSVKESEKIVQNGARALFISFNNPPITHATQSEWLDSDQYWQAFVEKHMYHANYLNTLTEDPESKESVAAIESEALKRWDNWDGKNVERHNNKRLNQRPSYEYYDLYRGPLVEHMIFYLTKTGGDSRMFPELLPHQWFCEIYNNRFEVYNVLQRRKRSMQEKGLLREVTHDLCPHDLDHEGEAYFENWIKKENSLMELCVARLMGNFMFLSEYIPIQTESALLRAVAVDDGAGKFWTLGDDVHALFYQPATALEEESPLQAFENYMDHMKLSGLRFTPGYNQMMLIFYRTLESRKSGMKNRWFSAPGESIREAFMRRLSPSDPSRPVYEAYEAEFLERWKQAKEIQVANVLERLPELERKYRLECQEFDNLAFAISEDAAAAKEDAPTDNIITRER